jgi:hypothetical protein
MVTVNWNSEQNEVGRKRIEQNWTISHLKGSSKTQEISQQSPKWDAEPAQVSKEHNMEWKYWFLTQPGFWRWNQGQFHAELKVPTPADRSTSQLYRCQLSQKWDAAPVQVSKKYSSRWICLFLCPPGFWKWNQGQFCAKLKVPTPADRSTSQTLSLPTESEMGCSTSAGL